MRAIARCSSSSASTGGERRAPEPGLDHEAVLGIDCLLSGTGYTGEQGCELLCNAADAAALWDRVLEAGVRPCGMQARDSLRIEMGYIRHGQDHTVRFGCRAHIV